ncbi:MULTISPECIES: hypothetical protein [unclassified Clostridium]|nr:MULTISPECIES: hypothetical protein [unclassified Clostridium]
MSVLCSKSIYKYELTDIFDEKYMDIINKIFAMDENLCLSKPLG